MMPRLLLVEDDAAQRLLLRLALHQRVYRDHEAEIIEAPTVMDAIAAPGRFDVIICDYHLPDGTARDVHAGRPEVRAGGQFVVVSGYDPPADWPVPWIRKPLDLAEVATAIRAILWPRRPS